MSNNQVKPKKKRGRKPKNLIKKEISEEKKEFVQNLIIKLNTKQDVIDNVCGFSNDIQHDEIINKNKSELCWNCCHKFHNIIHGLPLKYIAPVFYTYGDFCSPECSLRYASDNYSNRFFEISSLVNLYNNIINNSYEPINMAPNKLLLTIFGGNITIEKYRENFKNNNLYDIKLPPILPIKHNSDIYESNNNSLKGNLKLYRKKELNSEKKNISKSMNLIINETNN